MGSDSNNLDDAVAALQKAARQSTSPSQASASAISRPDDDNDVLLAHMLESVGLRTRDAKGKQRALPPGRIFDDEEMETMIRDRYVTPQTSTSDSFLGTAQVQWERSPDYKSLLALQPCAFPTRFVLQHTGLEGRVTGLKEVAARPARTTVKLAAQAGQTAGGPGEASASRASRGNITSITRSAGAQGSFSNFVRGKVGQSMYVPGGLESDIVDWDRLDDEGNEEGIEGSEAQHDAIKDQVAAIEAEISKGVGLRTLAPGLKRRYRKGGGPPLEADADQEIDEAQGSDSGFVGIEIDNVGESFRRSSTRKQQTGGHGGTSTTEPEAQGELDADVDELLPLQKPTASTRQPRHELEAKREWAHVVDVNRKMTDFHELVPDMAHKYSFELDDFQKEAVYHLEQGDSVFVAAHTSAGKTVVAEYAIALASKHMTRCIYTSPIKALSNQKFREFKHVFGAQNVGILTGDVQINPEAPCLIMTTEILRSMLYRGADLIRDVEFVIFDEVHYVNDQERGVVWEEVIILCPQHINLILLSATVPNTQEFAGWVGRTKKKDIYVISTPKRPVPLEHFLYAGKDLFKVVDAKGQFLGSGVKDAGEAIRRRQDKDREANGIPLQNAARGGRGQQRGQRGTPIRGRGVVQRGRGGGGNFSGGGQSGRGDKSLWVHLVGLLKKRDLLPVVTFVFSKKRCEENASSLPNTDLCNAREKSEVHVVIERSLTRLKGANAAIQIYSSFTMFELTPPYLHRHRQEPASDRTDAGASESRHRSASWWFATNRQRSGRDSVPAWSCQGALCHRDVCHGCQHACPKRRFLWHFETRWTQLPRTTCRGVHTNVRACWTKRSRCHRRCHH